MPADLGRAYRRLLRAYPPGPRREELLDTLLEAAPPTRRRPTVRESVNLVRHGLRARLGFPRSRAVVVLVFLAGLVGAYFGGAAGNRLGLEFVSPVPSAAVAGQVTATVFPGLKVWGGGHPAAIVPQSDGEGVEYGYATYWLRHTEATRDLPAYATGARERLAAAGWQIHDYAYQAPEDMVDRGQDSSVTFWADRPGLVLGFEEDLYTGMPDYDNDGGSTLTLRRSEPGWLSAFTWSAAVLGFALAWLLAARASRRFDSFGVGGVLPGILTGIMLFLFLPPLLLFPIPDTPGQAPFWAGLESGYGWLPLPLVLGGILALGSALPDLRRHPRVSAAGAVVIVLGIVAATTLPTEQKPVAHPACRPAPGPPPAPPDGRVAGSTTVHIYVDPASTPHQRALITAAMRRSWAGGDGDLVWDPGSAAFKADYCGGGAVEAAAVPSLPYFFPFELDVPTDYPALLQEVQGMPGVVAVHRVPRQAG
jgi:hypothetical protein